MRLLRRRKWLIQKSSNGSMVISQCIWCSIKWNVWTLQAQGKHGRNRYSSQEQYLWDYKQKARYILWNCNVGKNTGSGNNSWNFICQYLLKNRDGLFDSECVNAFFYAFTHSESFICLSDNYFEMKLWEIIPRQKQVFDWKTCKNGKRWITPRIPYLPKPCHNYCMEWQVFCFSVLHLGPFYFKSFGACAISTLNNIRSKRHLWQKENIVQMRSGFLWFMSAAWVDLRISNGARHIRSKASIVCQRQNDRWLY